MATENSKKVLQFLKDNAGREFTANEIKDALGLEKVQSVNGAVTSFVNKGWAVREDVELPAEDGKKAKTIKKISITENGMTADPDAKPEKE